MKNYIKYNLIKKILIVNGLICISFVIITGVVLFSYRSIHQGINDVFMEHNKLILENSKLVRELSRIIADIALFINSFYGNAEIINTSKDKISRSIAEIIEKSSNDRLKASLARFERNLKDVFVQCEILNDLKKDIDSINSNIEKVLSSFGESVSEKMVDITMAGNDASEIEQLSYSISIYRESYLRLNIYLAKMDPTKQSLDVVEKNPVILILNDIYAKIKATKINDAELQEFDNKLIENIQKEQAKFKQLIDASTLFHQKNNLLKSEKEQLLTIIAEIDENISGMTQIGLAQLEKRILMSMIGTFLVVGVTVPIVLLAFLLSISINKSLNRVINGLKLAFDQVAENADQVASASKQLAEGSSEQASSLEETSSFLEEMASMSRKNTENAGNADSIVKSATSEIEQANHSMVLLMEFMNELSITAQETRSIIKSIDEIAFQTNLLALNAAVEAARAGQAGVGFAVVADEVRNLALRVADAAKNSTGIIENSIRKILDGLDMVASANKTFEQIKDGSRKIGECVTDIAVASGQQKEGIEQVNKTIAEMDKLVQQYAAYSEQLAGTSDQMKHQASQVKELIQELSQIVGK